MTERVDLAWAERELLEVASQFRQAAAYEDDIEKLKAVARRFVKAEEAVKARQDYDKPYYAVGRMPDLQQTLQPLADAVNYQLKPGERFVPQAEMDEVMRKACTPSFDHIKKAKAGK